MPIKFTAILLLLTSVVVAQDYPLPEVIGRIHNGGVYGYDYCSIGDQNGDGCDDLMARHWGQVVDVYYGGENMGEELDFRFDPREFLGDEFPISVERIWSIGNLMPNRESFIGITATVISEPVAFYTLLYEGGDSLSQTPNFTLTNRYLYKFARSSSYLDFNGDGFHDLLIKVVDQEGAQKLQVYFGGADFDTIPDWEVEYISGPNRAWVTGCDINSDGYDDFIFRNHGYSLFLGGDPPDTNCIFHIEPDQFEGRVSTRRTNYGYSMLQDVNDDGYDDWGLYFTESDGMSMNDGYMIFFGGEEPDMIPDLELEGHRIMWHQDGELCGGDFNGDGIGDIATGMSATAAADMGEVHIHFGSRWIDGETDIFINSGRDYDGEFFPLGFAIGGVGDYNGDGIDDFVARGRWEDPLLVIFAGNRDWQVDAPDEQLPQDHNISLNAFPNPFNDKTKLEFSIPQTNNVTLAIFDLKGRLIKEIVNRQLAAGDHNRNWNYDISGIYFAKLSVGPQSEIRKVVCLR